MRLHGVTIQIVVRAETGTDIFGHPIYAETTEDVENVLIGLRPLSLLQKKLLKRLTLTVARSITGSESQREIHTTGKGQQ